METKIKNSKKCIFCGKINYRDSDFCSKKCYQKGFYNHNRDVILMKEREKNKKKSKWRLCIICNKKFIVSKYVSGQICCSKKCTYKNSKDKILQNQKTTIGRIKHNLRGRLNRAIKSNYKSGSAVRDLGCSIEELKIHLESQFQLGMSWDNWSRIGWHIDHIKPLSSFNLENIEEFKKACHYSNLQPLWAQDNISKGAKYGRD